MTLDGQPVANARVVFRPRSGRSDGIAGADSDGWTDEQGRFSLATIEATPKPGAAVGLHKVTISTYRAKYQPDTDSMKVLQEETLPPIYADYQFSPLEFTVPTAGTDQADFELKQSGPPW